MATAASHRLPVGAGGRVHRLVGDGAAYRHRGRALRLSPVQLLLPRLDGARRVAAVGPPELRLALPNTVDPAAQQRRHVVGESGMRAGEPGPAAASGLRSRWCSACVFLAHPDRRVRPQAFHPTIGRVRLAVLHHHRLPRRARAGRAPDDRLRARSARGSAISAERRHLAVTNVAWYWHFVDVVWLAVFTSLYLSPRIALAMTAPSPSIPRRAASRLTRRALVRAVRRAGRVEPAADGELRADRPRLLSGSEPRATPFFGGLWTLVLVVSLAALAVAAAAGGTAWRSWRTTRAERPGGPEHLLESGAGRTRFMALAGLLLSGLFFLGVMMAAIPLFLVPPCG